jgi:steroid 5-alpha reductase family enzyme
VSFWAIVLVSWLGAAVGMAAVWAVSMRVRNVGYVDVAWAGLMALAALFAGFAGEGDELPRLLVALFGGIWGARLCLHLLHRVLREPEDGRYQAMRAAIGDSPGRWFVFFQAQAVVVGLFAIPFAAAAGADADGLEPLLLGAIAVWLIAIAGESLADRQLDAFRRDPANKGQLCRTGLWAWSRHPNYFFEWVHWFAYVLLAACGPYLLWSLLGPVLMWVFLWRVSGIPWTEAQALRSRPEAYRRYQREVSAFFPWPPKAASPSSD